ncbi:MAG: hypothetical protein ABL867_10470, partial [Rickettsiales bacterium]
MKIGSERPIFRCEVSVSSNKNCIVLIWNNYIFYNLLFYSLPRQLIRPLVHSMTVMTFYPVPFNA